MITTFRRPGCRNRGRTKGKPMKKLICILVSVWTFSAICPAQESRATLIGRTTDPSGAVVAGATVRATNTATNATVTTTSNESGNYEIPYLLPGDYRVAVEMRGFK